MEISLDVLCVVASVFLHATKEPTPLFRSGHSLYIAFRVSKRMYAGPRLPLSCSQQSRQPTCA
eukprot:9519231-Lingulodinium_polyedra.AAC.1